MPNNFLGFPVPYAKIAGMIKGSAASKTHHTTHEPGGADEMDATGLTGAGTPPLDKYHAFVFPEAINLYKCTKTGGGSFATATDAGLYLRTGATSGGASTIKKDLVADNSFFSWSKKREGAYFIRILFLSSNIGTVYIGPGQPNQQCAAYFYVKNGVLYGRTEDSEGRTEITLETLGAGAFDVHRILRLVSTPVQNCKFYVNHILRGTSTTHLPTCNSWGVRALQAEIYNDTKNAENSLFIDAWGIDIAK